MAAELRDAALGFAARGWRVIPLRPNDKRPAIRDWQSRATCDPDRILGAWAANPQLNVGVACGPSGLVVIDLDVPKDGAVPPPQWRQPGILDGSDVLAALAENHGEPLPVETYNVRTTSGGQHLYYRAPSGTPLRNTAGRLGWLIDSRAQGGYVVAAGSRIDERRYVELLDMPPTPLPNWIVTALRELDPSPVNSDALVGEIARRSRYAASALRGELDRVLAAAPGSRNHTLNAAAYALGQLTGAGLLPAGLAAEALAAAAAAIGLPAGEAAATIRSGRTAGARHPRTLRPGRAG